MKIDRDIVASDDCETWADRNARWLATRNVKPARARRSRERSPLILCGHGVAMRIERGALVITEGRTHHPQQPVEHRYFKGDLALPPRIVMVDGSGSLSFDVIDWLGEQSVALIHLTWDGRVQAVVGGDGYCADRKRVAWQEATRDDLRRRLEFSADLVRRKLENSLLTLDLALPSSKARAVAIQKTGDAVLSLRSKAPESLTALRLVEAICANAYFSAWRSLEFHWTGTARRPIPDDWMRFTSRTSLANNGKLLNINASHPLNAMLNYGYTALEGRLRVQAVAEGYDPTIGIMHHGRRGKSAYVFDLMEPERPKVDAAILAFVRDNKLSAADFVIRQDGVCRLAPQMAAHIAGLVH